MYIQIQVVIIWDIFLGKVDIKIPSNNHLVYVSMFKKMYIYKWKFIYIYNMKLYKWLSTSFSSNLCCFFETLFFGIRKRKAALNFIFFLCNYYDYCCYSIFFLVFFVSLNLSTTLTTFHFTTKWWCSTKIVLMKKIFVFTVKMISFACVHHSAVLRTII